MPVSLPSQPDSLGVLQAMQSLILSECLVGGITPFAALSSADALRYGVAHAVFVGRPKDFADAYLPQCCLWVPEGGDRAALTGYAGRASSDLDVHVEVFADQRADWYAGEQQILAIRDALWPVLLRHEQLGGTVPSVSTCEARTGRGLCYETVAGVTYRCYEAIWLARQQWTLSGGRTA